MAKERHNLLIKLKCPGQFRQGGVPLLWLPTDAVPKRGYSQMFIVLMIHEISRQGCRRSWHAD